jgi:type I restriction enzyme S subunit
MSSMVPDGWESKQLIECGIGGISNGVFCDPKNVGSGYKLINVYEMYQGYGVDVNLTRRLKLTEKEFLNNKVEYGDVLFTRSSLKLEGIAYCNINLSHDDDITYDGHLMKIRPNARLVNAEYLARYCLSDFARTYFMSTAKHSTMTTIAQADIAPLKVLLPPLPEQQKIAQILTSVDEVIEKTQAQIDKLKDLKTAMMQELLTKGVCDENGKRHVEFKDSPVGMIPVGWEVVRTGDIAKSIVPGRNKPKSLDGDIPWLTISDLGDVYVSQSKTKLGITREVLADANGKTIPENTVIMTVVGEFGLSSVALCEMVINQQLHGFVCKENVDPTFLCLSLRFHKAQMDKLATKTTIAYMNKENAESILVALPTLAEQKKIVGSIMSVEEKVRQMLRKYSSLNNTKKALMQDLLTGKVRVRVS